MAVQAAIAPPAGLIVCLSAPPAASVLPDGRCRLRRVRLRPAAWPEARG